jgi:hypothetical protein
VVVDDEVHVEVAGNMRLDVAEESEVFLVTMPLLASLEHFTSPVTTLSAAKSVVVPCRA